MLRETLCNKLREAGIVKHGSVSLSGGQESSVYYDVKGVCADHELKALLEDGLMALIREHTPQLTCIAADVGFGPLLGGMSSLYHLPNVLVRKEAKETGMARGLLDYYIPSAKDSVVIVDDVFTKGNSIRRIVNALKPTQAKILGAYVVIQREESKLDIPMYSLFRAEEFE